MKLLSTVAFAAVALTTCTSVDSFDVKVDLESDFIDTKTKYQAWKHKFEITFGTLEDEAKAMVTFAQNDRFIRQHNKEGRTYTVAHNEFSHLTTKEFKEQKTGYRTKDKYLRRLKSYDNTLKAFASMAPSSVDWVKKGAVTAVKNQGSCGGCWSFSTTGAVEGAYAIAGNDLISLSEQDLIDCDKTDKGCEGGLMDNAFDFIVENGGICSEEALPYTGQDGTCGGSCTKVVTIQGHKDVPPNDEDSLKSAVAIGPVSVAIEADSQAFQFYKGGVFNNDACGTQLDHGVLAVGYGTDNGDDYWKVKNSWGGSWGENGYIRMSRGNNMCGISQSPSYPTGAGAATKTVKTKQAASNKWFFFK